MAVVSTMQKTDDDEHEQNQKDPLGLFNPRRALCKYLVLVFICLLAFGGYYCYDMPGSLQEKITSDMQVSTLRFSNLYSLYSWPNIALCFVNGFLIDRIFGLRWGTVFFNFTVLGGQLLVALGAFVNHFWLMEVGRFIFGVGLEPVLTCQNAFAPRWFKKKELNTVFGLQLSVARLGSTLTFVLNPIVYTWVYRVYSGHTALGMVLFVVSATCALSLLGALLLAYFDWKANAMLQKNSGETGGIIRLKDVKDFPAAFWLLDIVCCFYYGAVIPFVGLGKEFFIRKYEMDDVSGWNSAGTIDSVVYMIPVVAAPVFGILSRRVGNNAHWIFLSVVMTLFCFIVLTFTFVNPWIPMVILGLGYSILASTMWPMVPLMIPQHQLATAYGLMQSAQSLGLALLPMAGGFIVDAGGYMLLMMFFIDCLSVAAIAAIVMLVLTISKTDHFALEDSAAAVTAIMKKANPTSCTNFVQTRNL